MVAACKLNSHYYRHRSAKSLACAKHDFPHSTLPDNADYYMIYILYYYTIMFLAAIENRCSIQVISFVIKVQNIVIDTQLHWLLPQSLHFLYLRLIVYTLHKTQNSGGL